MKYIILGESGEYDDYRAFPVAYADTEIEANQALATLEDIRKNMKMLLAGVRELENANFKNRPIYPSHPQYPYASSKTYDERRALEASFYNSSEFLKYKADCAALQATDEFKSWAATCADNRAKNAAIKTRFESILAPGELEVSEVNLRIVPVHTVADLLRSKAT
jgi:hypothetical protein